MHKAFRRRRESGQALVELVLVFPVMLLILLIAADFGRLFFSYISVTNAAREAANYAAVHAADDPFDASTYVAGATAAALGETNVQGQQGAGALSLTDPLCFDPLDAGKTPIDCHAASDFAPGIGRHVSVTASQPFTFLTPVISGILGVLPLGATATAPVMNPPVAPPTPEPTPVPGSLVVTKNLAGDLTDFSGGDFTFSVFCNGVDYGPVTITAAGLGETDASPISGIPAGVICTVTEIDKENAGPHASWDDPAAGQATTVTGEQVNVTITNTRSYDPPGPDPTPTPTPGPTPTPAPCVSPTITPNSTSGNTQTISIDFVGASAGAPQAWDWDFGDGTTATGSSSVTHQFIYTKGNGAQTWTVTLTTTTNGGACSRSTTATVRLNP